METNGATEKKSETSAAEGAEQTASTGAQPAEDTAQARIRELEAQVKEKEAKYLYLYADFENYKKRAIRERADLLKFGWESAAHELLQVVDNLERAIDHMPPATDSNLATGLQMVLGQFKAALQKQGVQHIESLKQNFDPNVHEAVSQEDSEVPAGTVVKEHARGYTLHGRLLRPSRVTVSKGKAG